MVFNQISIYNPNGSESFKQISKILNLEPIASEGLGKLKTEQYVIWTYSVETNDEEPYFDFINRFLDILKPNFENLFQIGIKREDISFWHLYEYDQQCAMEFMPKEMERLGKKWNYALYRLLAKIITTLRAL